MAKPLDFVILNLFVLLCTEKINKQLLSQIRNSYRSFYSNMMSWVRADAYRQPKNKSINKQRVIHNNKMR